MKFNKRILSFILAFAMILSHLTPVLAKTSIDNEKNVTKAQEIQIGDNVYYIFSKDKNAKGDLIKSQEKTEKKTEAIQTSDGLDLSDNLFGRPVGAGRPASYTLNIKGNKFIGVGEKTFDWDTLPEGLELQVFYIDENYLDVNIGNPITINKSNYQDEITRTFDIAEQPLGFGFKTNVDTETYLTDVYLTNESAPEPGVGSLDMTFDLVQVPSTKLDVKWVDVNQQPLARENTPATSLKDILTFNFIEGKKFDLPNQDKVDSYFRLNNKIGREEVKDIKDATALVGGKKNGEEVTLDGKIYKLNISYDPAFNKGSKIELMYMPDVIDRTKNPDAPTPNKYVRVTIDAGEGAQLVQGETKKVYDVRVGKVLKAEHYPKLEISDSAKYKEPITWTIAPGTAITKAESIKGNAAKTAAETITAANLKAVDTTALQGQDFPEKFWNDGVALADNVDAAKKTEYEALLKDATVTDITNPARTTAEAGDKVGTLLVTFKDGSKLEVQNQKLIVKPNTVTVAFDKAQGKEHPLRDGDTTVKGKITASSNSDKFPVSLDGAVVTIKKGNTVLTRTLANADGSFVAGVKDKLIAGEVISVVVTLPESKTASAPVTEKVQLNPDKLNSIIPTGKEVFKHFDGKKGVNQDLVKALKAALDEADKLVDDKGKVKSTVKVDATGQKSLDDQYEAIKKAIEALTGNSAPKVTGTTSHKEIFKGDALNLEDGIKVTDADGETDIDKTGGKAFTYAVQKVDAKGNKTPVTDNATINQTAGTYEVTYTAKDKSGAEGTFVMTLVVKEPVIKIEDKFPEVIPEGYVKVEFKSGNHAGLKGTSKFLVKEGGAKSLITEPEIVPEEGWKVNDPKWTEPIPDTFATNFETTANMLEKVKTTEPTTPEEKAKYVTVEFKADDAAHTADPRGTFENVGQLVQTTKFWVLKGEQVKFNVPTVTEKENYKFTGWNNEVKASYDADAIHTATYKEKVKTQDPNDATNYAKLTFEAGDHGKFDANAQTTIWVLKDTEVKFNPPSVIANKDFTFDKWEPEIKKSYNADQTHTAKYTTTLTVSDEKVEGYQEVKFVSGTDGNFGKDGETPITEKSVWVKPDTLVDLRSKAPTVIVTAEKKSFVGWDKDLVGEFKLETENNNPKATLINAEYDSTVKTEKPTKHADKFAKVDFSAGNLGSITEGSQTTFYIVKGEKVTDDFKAPAVTPVKDWKVKEGKAAWSPEVAETYNKDTIHLAQYDYTGGGLVEQKPGDPKPNVPDKFKKIEFKPGAHGIISSKETTIFWADPDQALKLTPPKVIANTGYVHDAWDPAVPTEATKFTEAKTYTATYKNDEGISETPKPGYIAITFDAGENGRINGNKTKTVYANPEMEVTLTAPEVTPNPGYLNDGWDPVVPTVKTKFTQPTTYTAKYKDDEDISKTEKPGYIPVTFDAGLNGTIEGKRTSTVYVNPAKAVKVTAPTVDANAGYTFDKWDPVIPTDAKQYTTPAIYTANYTKGTDISETEVKGFIKVSFNAGDHGNFGMTTTEPKTEILSKDLWIRPNTPVDLTNKAPSVTPKTGWLVNGWSRSLVVEVNKNSTTEDKTITAQYVADTSVSETEKPGYTKITFKAGEHGNFGIDGSTPVTEKNLWLNPEADVKLSEKAPKTIDDINWSFDKWMEGENAATGLDQAKKYTEVKTYTATYESDFSDVAKKGFVKVEFKAGDHGKFEQVNGQDQVTTIYVRKDKEVDITVKEPKVTPDNGYYFTGWDKPLQKVYTEDTTHTGKNTNAIADQAVEGWTQITFNAGDKGLFKPDAKTVLWVKPGTKVALDKQVPGLEIQKGYSCIGWKKDAETTVTDLTVPATYDKSTTFTAAYESDFSKETKEGFIEVKFKAGDNGNFGKTTGASSTEVKDYSLWVRPDKEVDLTDQAPKVYPNVGWKLNGWDKTLTITVNAQTVEADRTFTAQYLKDDDVSDTKKEGYIEITFNAGDHGTFPNDAKTVKYVNPDSEIALSTIAPTVNPAINYSFKAWNNGTADVALDAKIKYTQTTNYKATYESDISDTAKEGFVEVKFSAGTDGEFKQVNGADQKTTFYVKKGKLVDLTDVAPTATGKDKKTFTSWDSELKRTFTDASTTINAKYTESISDTYVEGWTEITFMAGEHGNFGKDGTTPVVVKKLWVDPKAKVALNEKAPKVTPYTNWLFDKWMDGSADATLSTPAMYTDKKTFTANYKSVFSDKKEDDNVLITFKPGDNGRFANGAKTTTYVAKGVEVDLTEKAPVVIPNQNYGHKGWDPALKGTFTQSTDITARYEKGTFKADELTSIDVFGPTKLSYAEGQQLDLSGLKIVVKDKAGIQQTYVGAKAITDAGFTITPADKTELKIDLHNGKSIKVSKEITVGQDKKTIEGETVSTLSVSMNKSADPTDVLARNLGENPQKTTVIGKAPEGSIIKVTDIDGKDLTDGTEIKADSKGEFTITLKDKLAPGTPVKVTSTEPGKTESSPVVKQVFEDINSDGTDDEKQKSAMPTDVKAMNQNKVENGKVTDKAKTTTTVTGKAKADAEIKIYNANGDDITPAGGVKADPTTGEFTAEVARQDDNAVIKVTAKEAEKALPSDPALASVIKDADNDGDADGDRVTLRPSALARNIGTGTTTPKTPAKFTTVEGDTEKGASVTVSYTFNGQAKTKVVTADTQGTNGLYTYKAELEDKLPAGTVVTVKAIVVGKKESTPTEAVVFEDLDGDKTPDGQGELDFTKIVDFKLVSDPNKMDYALKSTEDNDKKALDPTGLKVFLKDASGNTGIYEYNKAEDSKFKELKGDNNFKLELVDAKGENPVEITADTKLGKDNDANKIKVTVMNGQTKTDKSDTTGPLNVFIDANGNGIDDDKEKIDLAKVKEIKVVNQPELNYPITEKGGKKNIDLTKMVVEVSDGTVKAKFTAQELLDAKVGEDKAFKLELVQGSATAAPTTKDITSVNGIELTTANDGNKVQISKASDANVKTETEALQVFEDLDGDGKRDSKQTPAPKDLKALNTKDDNFTTITGKATKGDTLKVYGEDKKEIPVDQSNITIDENGNFTIKVSKNDSALPEGTTVFVTAKAENKEESARIPVIVQVDKDGNGTADKDETTTITSVIARNIGTGDTTPKKAATFTTIEGVAEPGSTVTIKFTPKAEEGQTAQEVTKTVTAGDDGSYKLELKAGQNEIASDILLPADTVVKAQAKFGDKKPSGEIETKVFDDLNADGKDDKAVNQKTGTPTVKALNVGKEPTVTTITGKAEKGAKVVAKATIENKEVVVGSATADDNGDYKIEATKTGKPDGGALDAKTPVTVTAQTTGKLVSDPASDTVKIDADGNGVADDEEDGPSEPNFDTVKVGETSVKVEKPTDPTITKIIVKDQAGKEVEVVKTIEGTEPNTKVVWKVGTTPVKEENGKLVIPTEGALTFGANQIVTVTVKDDKNKEASTTKAVQPADLEKMVPPTIDPISTETTKITGSTLPGSTVNVFLPGEPGSGPVKKEASVKSDGSFELILDKTLDDGVQITVEATNPQRDGTGTATATVGIDTSKLQKSIDKAEQPDIAGKDGENLDSNKPIDKTLKDALENAKKVKDAVDKHDPNTKQKDVNDAKDALDKAIAEKVADTAVEKAKNDPTPENIKDAQDKIDAIPGTVNDNPVKKKLQDKLDLIEKIKEGEDRLNQDDVTGGKDGKTPKKPGDLINDLKKAVEEGKEALKKEEKMPEATAKIDDALKKIDMERIEVGVKVLGKGLKTLKIQTSVPGATVVIKINNVVIDTIETSSYGTFSKGLKKALEEGQEVTLEASKPGYNDGKYNEIVE